MKKINIMLCCGAGMSTGFLATSARKYVKKSKLEINIEARSQSEVSLYLDQIDILLLGPHFESALERFKSLGSSYDITVALIPKEIYGCLDGEGLIKFALNQLKDKE